MSDLILMPDCLPILREELDQVELIDMHLRALVEVTPTGDLRIEVWAPACFASEALGLRSAAAKLAAVLVDDDPEEAADAVRAMARTAGFEVAQ